MAQRTAYGETADVLRAHWNAHEAEFRDDENYTGSEVVYEDTDIVIVADHNGHELPTLLRDHETPTQAVVRHMTEIAVERTEYDWSDATPMVFPKA